MKPSQLFLEITNVTGMLPSVHWRRQATARFIYPLLFQRPIYTYGPSKGTVCEYAHLEPSYL